MADLFAADGVRLLVDGIPAPKGSWIPFRRQNGTLGVRAASGAALVQWTDAIKRVAHEGYVKPYPKTVGVAVNVIFNMPIPKRATYDYPPRPDVDKLSRAVLDALTGIVYEDDAQVVELIACKQYGDRPGADITIVARRTE